MKIRKQGGKIFNTPNLQSHSKPSLSISEILKQPISVGMKRDLQETLWRTSGMCWLKFWTLVQIHPQPSRDFEQVIFSQHNLKVRH